MSKTLPDHILKNISITVKKYGDVKGQPSFKERVRKALVYQECARRERKKLVEVTA